MKLIKTIQFNNDLKPEEVDKFEIRKAARAVVFDENNNIGLLFVGKCNYHKLPGGGIEDGENIAEALDRECLEEIGCNIETYGELGEIIEYRDKWSLKQHSYCYLAKVVGKKGEPDFTQKELDNGFEIKWVTLSKAIELLKNDKPEGYEGVFIQKRDSLFLKEVLENIFYKTREYIKESFNKNDAQMKHFDRTVHWIKELKKNVDETYLVAAIGHDIERAFREEKDGFDKNERSFKDEGWLDYHCSKGAEILEKFLSENKASLEFIEKVKHLVSKHEMGGGEDQNLLKDADSLSFVENNADIFLSKIDKLGYERVKEKFDWMYERISSPEAKKLAKPFYDDMMQKLEALK